MDTNKAAYWIAVGVLALGLNSEYKQGHFPALHRVADRAEVAMCHASAKAEQTIAMARLSILSKGLAPDALLASVDRAEMDRAEMARDQAELIREQAREEAERIRQNVSEQVGDEIRARAEVMRAQAEVQRARIERIRFETRDQFRFANASSKRIVMVCPKTGKRIAVKMDGDSASLSRDVSPEVEESSTF
jgi:hypothetical protein